MRSAAAAATGNKEEAVSLFLPSLFHLGGVEEITFLPLYPLPGITTAADRAEAVGPFADGLSPSSHSWGSICRLLNGMDGIPNPTYVATVKIFHLMQVIGINLALNSKLPTCYTCCSYENPKCHATSDVTPGACEARVRVYLSFSWKIVEVSLA